jgi:ABC-type sulfate transport system permease subunit
LHLYENRPEELTINGQSLKISRATYPSDIFWFNLKVRKWTRLGRIGISYLVLLVALVIVFAAITAIEVGSEDFDKSQSTKEDNLLNRGIGYGTTVLVALLVYLVNYIFGLAMKYLTDK